MKEQRRTWYVLKSRDESIEMWFTHYDRMIDYWKHMPMQDGLKCYWEIQYKD